MTAKRYATYRLFDANDALLYVGCSAEPEKRVLRHRRQSWGAEISRVAFSTHETREDAAREEHHAMINEYPRHNRRLVLDCRTDRSWRPRGPQTSATRKIGDLLLGGKLDDFVLTRRSEGRAWRLISRDLWEETGGELDVTYETLRSWFPDDRDPHTEAAAS